MQTKIIISIIFCLLLIGLGFFIGRKTADVKPMKNEVVLQSITNITSFTNFVDKLEYISNNNMPYVDLQNQYNELLKYSKSVSYDYGVLLENHNRLEKIISRKLFFLVGGSVEYNIDREAVDLGLSAGVEYNRFSFILGYLFIESQINLSVMYRF